MAIAGAMRSWLYTVRRGSRYKFGIADAEARRLGLRLISPDRWGHGLSDAPQDAAWLGDYAADIADLAQSLNLSCFGVVGISGGGPYAVALVSQLPERVKALALVAPVAPVSRAEERRGVSLYHRFAFHGLPGVPGAVPLAILHFRGLLMVSVCLAARTMSTRAGTPDRKLLADPDIAADQVRIFRAVLASVVKGAALDMRCLCRAWRLDFGALNMPERMWIGGQDRNVPLPAARKVAERIDMLDVIEINDDGHFG